MTQEEKQLLLKDLCARLPYGVKCKVFLDIDNHILNERDKYSDSKLETINYQSGICTFEHLIGYNFGQFPIEDVKPYLRPMSNMTEEERKEYLAECDKDDEDSITTPRYHGIDWLNEHHFDYRGLIPMGLALEAPADMYK